jgi:hypothetical protein
VAVCFSVLFFQFQYSFFSLFFFFRFNFSCFFSFHFYYFYYYYYFQFVSVSFPSLSLTWQEQPDVLAPWSQDILSVLLEALIGGDVPLKRIAAQALYHGLEFYHAILTQQTHGTAKVTVLVCLFVGFFFSVRGGDVCFLLLFIGGIRDV